MCFCLNRSLLLSSHAHSPLTPPSLPPHSPLTPPSLAHEIDRYERFVVDSDSLKIDFEKDTRLPNAGTFVVLREDHSIGNLMRTQLHRDEAVTFAGYRIPHPLEAKLLVKLSTNGSKTPIVAAKDAITQLKFQISSLNQSFSRECSRQRQDAGGSGGYR